MSQHPNAITLADQSVSIIPGQSEWTLMREMANELLPTGFLPDSIKKPEQAVAIMLKGRELRVPPMYALSNIAVVKGKPTVSAEMMLALIYRDHGKRAIRVKSSDDTRCVVEYRLEGWNDTNSYEFSMEQASKAGLTNNPTWKSYPAAMLRARCISAVARMAFPECIAGMYVPGELGDDVEVTDDGQVVSAHAQATTVDQATGEIVAEDDPGIPWETASKKLHAIGGEHGIGHDVFHAWAVSRGHTSLRGVEVSMLTKLAERIDHDPEQAQVWAAKLMGDDEAAEGQQTIEMVEDEGASNRAYAEAVTR